jgi:hypothetical protein
MSKELKHIWTIKGNDEYAVFAKNKSDAVRKFRENLGIVTSKKMVIRN